MFRRMPVPRDTKVLREIIIICCESVGNCQTLSKDTPSQLVNNIIFPPFSLFFASDGPHFLPHFVPVRSTPTACFVHCFHVYQKTALYITWYSIMWLYFRFSSERVNLNCVTQVWNLSTYILINCEWFVTNLCRIGIIILTDLLWGTHSYYFSIDLFVCIFNINLYRSSYAI